MRDSVLPVGLGPATRISLIVCLLAALAAAPAQAVSKHSLLGSPDEVRSDRLYVRLNAAGREELAKLRTEPVIEGVALQPFLDEHAEARLETRKRELDADGRAALERLRSWLVAAPTDERSWEAAWVRLRASAFVDRVEPAYVHRVQASPDDPLYLTQATLFMLDAAESFNYLAAAPRDAIVGIVDGGTDWRHVDLEANVYRRPGEIEGNGIDDDGNGFVDDVVGWNFPANDGDPTASPNTPRNGNHGTHIAGIVGAVTNNGVGIASLGWNTRVMPVNAGADGEGEDNLILYGYEGLAYAALNGADIVNASWGRSSQRWSDFEYDVLNALQALDVLIVAAAGNLIEHQPFYPAFYPSVFSVAYVDRNWEVPWWGNRDDWIELSAPGSLWSTIAGDEYRILHGSSQSAAVVSAVASGVLALHPEYSSQQLRQHLRWTARDLDSINPDDAGLLGTGAVDPVKAYSEEPRGLRVSSVEPVPVADGAGIRYTLRLELHNELGAADDVSLRLASPHPSVILHESSLNVGAMLPGETRGIEGGLSLSLAPGAPYAEILPLRISILSGERQVHQASYFELRPLHMNLSAPGISMTHTANGRLAYADPLRSRDAGGIGIRGPENRSRVQTGSFLMSVGEDYVADALLELATPGPLKDFVPVGEPAIWAEEGGVSARSVHSRYDDSGSATPKGLHIEQSSWAFDEPGRDDFLLSRYRIRSVDADLSDVRAGILFDPEMDGLALKEVDHFYYLPRERVLIAQGAGDEMLAVAVIEGAGGTNWNWLHDIRPDKGAERPFLYDATDFEHSPSDGELHALLAVSTGELESPMGGTAAVLGTGSFELPRGEESSFVVAYSFGESQAEILDAMRRARETYAFVAEDVPAKTPERARLLGNVPNPFNPATEIRFALPTSGSVELDIYDLRGQLVRRLHRGPLASGYHRIPWKGVDERGRGVASGVYFVSLRTAGGTDSDRITLIR